MFTASFASFFKLDSRGQSWQSLLEFRKFKFFPPWLQIFSIASLYTATILFGYVEFKEKGTVQGYEPGVSILFVPIYEEIIFRGWILGKFAEKLAPFMAFVFSSLLFSLWHLKNIYWLNLDTLINQMLYTGFIFGPIMAYITLKTRSIWTAVILHYLNNLL